MFSWSPNVVLTITVTGPGERCDGDHGETIQLFLVAVGGDPQQTLTRKWAGQKVRLQLRPRTSMWRSRTAKRRSGSEEYKDSTLPFSSPPLFFSKSKDNHFTEEAYQASECIKRMHHRSSEKRRRTKRWARARVSRSRDVESTREIPEKQLSNTRKLGVRSETRNYNETKPDWSERDQDAFEENAVKQQRRREERQAE